MQRVKARKNVGSLRHVHVRNLTSVCERALWQFSRNNYIIDTGGNRMQNVFEIIFIRLKM